MARKLSIAMLIILIIITTIMPFAKVYADEEKTPHKENYGEVQAGISNNAIDNALQDGTVTSNPEGGKKTTNIQTGTSTGAATASAFGGILNIIPTTVNAIMNYIVQKEQVDPDTAGNGFTIQELVSNKYDLFNIDFFGRDNDFQKANGKIAKIVTIWFYAVRNLSIILSLLVLIYVGIRMSTSTLADDKAKYQKMFVEWVKGFALMFVVIYLIIISINVTNVLIDIIPKSNVNLEHLLLGDATEAEKREANVGKDYEGIQDQLQNAKGWNFIAICILYWTIVYYQAKFFILYFKRVLMVAFMLIISPLISVTYPIDAIGDGSAQAHKNLMSEMSVNIFIQPLHLLLYQVFIVTAASLVTVAPLLATFFFMGLSRGEKVVKNIFGMRNRQTISSLGSIKLSR